MSIGAHAIMFRDSRNGLQRRLPTQMDTNVYDQPISSVYVSSYPILKFKVRHLASFSSSESDQTPVDPEIGIEKLLQIYRANVPEPLVCLLIINGCHNISVNQANSNDELEKFPLNQVESPTYREFNDPKIPFKNVVMFKVIDQYTELHIFEAIDATSFKIAESISKALSQLSENHYGSPGLIRNVGHTSQQYSPPFVPLLKPSRNPMDSTSIISVTNTRETDREIYLLNRCFDDIEKFMKTLQNIVKTYKEFKLNTLRSGKTSVSSTKSKKSKGSSKYAVDTLLTTNSRLPPTQDFEDCLKKMKLSLVLVSRLQGKIRNPNNAELVHYLFRPLKVIVDATRDPASKKPELASKVVSPLLTRETILLLKCCLDSREEELWNSLGEAWTVCREDWSSYVPPYVPRFWDGYQPHLSDFDDSLFMGISPSKSTGLNNLEYEPFNESVYSSPYQNNRIVSIKGPASPSQPSFIAAISPSSGPIDSDWSDRLNHFAQEIWQRGGKVLQVTHNRIRKNQLELTVQKGEIVECLDDSKNWWKLRNSLEEVGYCPKNILSPYLKNQNGNFSLKYSEEYDRMSPSGSHYF